MNFIQKIIKLFRSPQKQKSEKLDPRTIKEIDQVYNFNKIAPVLLGSSLIELGYVLEKIENQSHGDFLWGTHHIYINPRLNLTVEVRQEPHYADYGFSVFLWSIEQKKRILICHVPHELQDKENNFLIEISDKLFADAEVNSLLNGQEWREIPVIRFD